MMSLAQINTEIPKVFVVDDDPTIHDVLARAIPFYGAELVSFSDGNSFLAVATAQRPDCILLDVSMPCISGLEVLQQIDAKKYPAPILMLSCRRDVASVVTAINAGAKDYITKPFDVCTVIERVQQAINTSKADGAIRYNPPQQTFFGAERLTQREYEILSRVTQGETIKETGLTLGISPRTVEVHRAHIMEKLGAKNVAHLVSIVLASKVSS
jgi:two-component system, LuxR family, response regulator FixJ